MERYLYFYSYRAFSFRGRVKVESWDIIEDWLIPQQSTFTTLKTLTITEGMIAVFPVDEDKTYCGIVRSINYSNKTHKQSISVEDISSILDIPVAVAPSDQVSYGAYISGLISSALTASSDPYQNIRWLEVVNQSTSSGATPAWGTGKTETILEALREMTDISALGAKFSFIKTGIRITLSDRMPGQRAVRLTDQFVSDPDVQLSVTKGVNKLRLIPQPGNELGTAEKDYYLLSNGTIGTEEESILRISPVITEIQFYSDDQYYTGQLDSTAESVLKSTVYDYSIRFSIRKKEMLSLFGETAYTGMMVRLYGIPGKQSGDFFDTVVTKVQMSESDYVTLTVGYSRDSLTDQLKAAGKKQSVASSDDTAVLEYVAKSVDALNSEIEKKADSSSVFTQAQVNAKIALCVPKDLSTFTAETQDQVADKASAYVYVDDKGTSAKMSLESVGKLGTQFYMSSEIPAGMKAGDYLFKQVN